MVYYDAVIDSAQAEQTAALFHLQLFDRPFKRAKTDTLLLVFKRKRIL